MSGARAAPGSAPEPPLLCKNCGATVTGNYCSECSQPRDVHVPSTREMLHEVLEGITHSDSRLWRTLKLLWLKPGVLTEEYIAGRRMRYLPPFRLYLILSVTYFFLASFGHQNYLVVQIEGDKHVQMNPGSSSCDRPDTFEKWGHPDWDLRIQRICTRATADQAELNHLIVSSVPKAMFVFLPVVAFFHMLFYWRPRHPYAVHWLYFLHFHAFFFSIATLSVLADDLASVVPGFRLVAAPLKAVLFLVTVIYTLKASRRVFKQGWTLTIIKGAGLSVVYAMTFAFTMLVLTVYFALRL